MRAPSYVTRIVPIGLFIAAGIALGCRPAAAVPAYARRTGAPCSLCHQPLFAHLTKTGWEFRRLGYRLPGEIGKDLQPGGTKEGEETTRYSFADAFSLGLRLRFDDIAREGVKRFDQGYISESNLYISAPYGKNLGFGAELGLYGQNPSVVTRGSTALYELGPSDPVSFGMGVLRWFSGTDKGFFSAKVGQVSAWDAYGANDRSISTGGALLFGTKVNRSASSATQRLLDVGYTAGDNHVSLVALEGMNSSGSGTGSRPGNNFDYEAQYIRWLDKQGSSAQLVYQVGNTPIDQVGSQYDRFHRLLVMGNYRRSVGHGRAVELMGAYLNGSHTKWVPGTGGGAPTTNGHFGIEGWFVEGDYEVMNKLAPYIRYEGFHSDELGSGPAWPGNPVPETHQFTLGIGTNPMHNVRLNLDFVHTVPNPGPQTDLIRAQAWFFF